MPDGWQELSNEFRHEAKTVTKAKRPKIAPQQNGGLASTERPLLEDDSEVHGESKVQLICDKREVCGTGKGKMSSSEIE